MKQCKFCFDWILESTFPQHELMCKKKLGAACKFCKEWFSQKHLATHERFCKQTEQCKTCGKWCETGMGCRCHQQYFCSESQNPQQQITRDKCKFCHKLCVKDDLKNHESFCTKRTCFKLFKTNFGFCGVLVNTSEPKRPRLSKDPTNVIELKRPFETTEHTKKCSFCHTEIFESVLDTHEQSCEIVFKQKREKCRFCNNQISKCLLETHERSCEVVLKHKRGKCCYCGEWFLYSGDIMQRHERTCAWKVTAVCKFCSQSVPVRGISMHEQSCQKAKCRYCSCSFAGCEMSDLKHHEDLCARQGVSFQLCHTCKGFYRPEQQHTCKCEAYRLSLAEPIAQHSKMDAGILTFDNITSDGYFPEIKTETETIHPELTEELYDTLQTKIKSVVKMVPGNEAKINAEIQEVCKVESKEEMKDTPAASQLFKMGNILVIQPETDTPLPCQTGNININIKPENEPDVPEQCKDGSFPAVKSETKWCGSFEINSDQSAFFMKSEPDVLHCNSEFSNSNTNIVVIKPETETAEAHTP